MSKLQETGSSWTTAQIDEDRTVVDAFAHAAGEGADAQLDACVGAALEEGSPLPMPRRFMLVLKALELHARHGGLSPANFNRLVEMAKSILRLCNIKPVKSKTSFLYGELHETISMAYAREGKAWEALWEFQVAQLLTRRGPDVGRGAQLLGIAGRCWRLAQGLLAEKLLDRAEAEGLAAPDAAACRLLRLRLLLLSDRAQDAAGIAQTLGAAADHEVAAEVAWLRALDEARRVAKSPEPVVSSALAEPALQRPAYQLQAWFLAKTSANREWSDRMPALKTIRGRFSDADRADPAVAILWKGAQSLDQAYDTERPLEQRLRLAHKAMEDGRRAAQVEHETLITAAVVRWLLQFNQMELAAAVHMEYQRLSTGLTCGKSTDALGLFEDLQVDVLLRRYARRASPEAGLA